MAEYFSCAYTSPVGRITLVATADQLVGLWFENQQHYLQNIDRATLQTTHNPILDRTTTWLDCYFAGGRPSPSDLPLAPIGSSFQQTVWRTLLNIPYGETISYGLLASHIADIRKMGYLSAQAVGTATGHNPISIIIPCHRVIKADGSIGRYAAGTTKKTWLLNHEKATR